MKRLQMATLAEFKHREDVAQANYFLHKESIRTEYLNGKTEFYLGNPIVFKKQKVLRKESSYVQCWGLIQSQLKGSC